jgi:glucokinase
LPEAILERALSGKDEIAQRTVDIFIDCYASEAANLALKGMTLGGVYIGGRIAPRIITALDKGRFMERFVKRGKMESMLAKMPVGIIIEDKTALIGAAGMVLNMS